MLPKEGSKAADAGTASWEEERRTFRARIRGTVRQLLLSRVIRPGSIRVGSGQAILATAPVSKRRELLDRLRTEDLAGITFEFDIRLPSGQQSPGCRRANKELRAKPTSVVSPHYVLLSEAAQVLLTHAVLPTSQLLAELMMFVRGQLHTTPSDVPIIDAADLFGLGLGDSPFTLRLPKPPHQVLAEGFRWARMTIDHATLELGEGEAAAALGELDVLARRVLTRCIVQRQARHVHDVLERVRAVLRPLRFSKTDMDKVAAAFSAAVGLERLGAHAVKKYRVGKRARR